MRRPTRRSEPPIRSGSERCRSQDGSTLLLYTDGLIERRGESLAEGFRRLEKQSSQAPGEPEAFCDSLLNTLPADEAVEDDIAILAVTLTGA